MLFLIHIILVIWRMGKCHWSMHYKCRTRDRSITPFHSQNDTRISVKEAIIVPEHNSPHVSSCPALSVQNKLTLLNEASEEQIQHCPHLLHTLYPIQNLRCFHGQGFSQGVGSDCSLGEISLPLLPRSGKFFSVKLPSPLAPGAKVRVSVEMVFTHVLQPYPTHITQSEKQFVVFEGNHYFYSPYFTKTQTTRVKLASRNVESYTKLGNPSRTEDMIEYGPFKDIPPYSQVNDCTERLWPWYPVSCVDWAGVAQVFSHRNNFTSVEFVEDISLGDIKTHNWEGRLLLTLR